MTSRNGWPEFRRLSSQMAALLSGRVLSALFQAIGIAWLARTTTLHAFGLTASVLAMSVVIQAISDVGATTYVSRETAICGVNSNVSSACLISIWGGIITTALALIAIITLALVSSEIYWSMLPLPVWMALERGIEVRSSIMLGLGNVAVGTRNLVCRRAVALLLFFVLEIVVHDGVLSFSLASALSSLVAWLHISKIANVPRAIGPKRFSAFKYTRHYWVNSVAVQLRNLDVSLVAIIGGASVAALYGAASRISTPLRMVPTSVATALLPHLSKNRGSTKHQIVALSMVMMVGCACLAVVAPLWVPLILGANYVDSVAPMQLLILGIGISSITSIISVELQARGQAKLVATVSITTSCLFLAFVSAGISFGKTPSSAALGAAGGMAAHLLALLIASKLKP